MKNKMNNKHEHGSHPNDHNFPKGMSHEHKYSKHHEDGPDHHHGKGHESKEAGKHGSINASHVSKMEK